MTFEKLRYAAGRSVATITLDDPGTRNALGDQTLDELIGAFEAARDDGDVRCVVLTSSHDQVFSAGGNLETFAAGVPLVHKHLGTERFPALFRLIGELGKPTLCAAGGHVLAGALGLALVCDLVVASERATFATPELAVGLFPFMVSALLVRNVGRKACAQLLLLGERIDAHEAHRLGIVNRVVAAEALDEAVASWARRLADRPPQIVKLGKDALASTQDMALGDALELLSEQLAVALRTADAREGVAAFLERREPRWSGR